MAGPGAERATMAVGRGHLRASHADRDQMIDALKSAFVQGRLTKEEFDARVAQALVSRTYAELATVTIGIPAAPARTLPPRTPPRRRIGNAARWGTSGLVTPAILAAGFVFASLRGASGFGAAAFLVAFVYFVFWLSAGADMLWEWYSAALPSARTCVRCAHALASHHAPASCTVRQGSLWQHCTCAGYVPPGLSPRTADRRQLTGYRSARTLRSASCISAAVAKRSARAGAQALMRNWAKAGLRSRRIVLGSVTGTPAMGVASGNGW
jgi:hypothetical protein